MTDRELLELAAKAAGIVVWGNDLPGDVPDMATAGLYTNLGHWNPLVDDGDALRLAVKLGLDLRLSQYLPKAYDLTPSAAPDTNDAFVDVRRAIVTTAAEIGGEK